jgi:hypothetical protein
MLAHFFDISKIKKPIHLLIILENIGWFLLLKIELEIESLLW